MKMLVTGGAGFIGSHVADKLIENKHEVIVFDNLSTGSEKNINKKALFVKGDISDKAAVESLFEKNRIETVFHLAAQIDVRISAEEPDRDAMINIVGTINVLNSMKKYGSKKIIFSSTGGALYGEVENPACENHEKNPKSPYGISKLTDEMYIKFFSEEYGLNYTILRYANVYGPRQSVKGEAGVVAIFGNRMIKNLDCTLYGFGKMYRDYVFVKDVAEANLISVNAGDFQTYNVGTGKKTNVEDLFEMLKNNYPEYKKTPLLKDKRQGEVMSSVIDASKIVADYNIKFTDVKEGLKITAEYFRSIND